MSFNEIHLFDLCLWPLNDVHHNELVYLYNVHNMDVSLPFKIIKGTQMNMYFNVSR